MYFIKILTLDKFSQMFDVRENVVVSRDRITLVLLKFFKAFSCMSCRGHTRKS